MTKRAICRFSALITLLAMSPEPLVGKDADVPTKPRKLLTIGGGFVMRPDGAEVAVIRNFRQNDQKTRLPKDAVEFVGLKTGKVTGKLGSQGPIEDNTFYVFNNLTYSRDGKRLVWCNAENSDAKFGVVIVHEIASGKEWTIKPAGQGDVCGPYFVSPDGKTLVSSLPALQFWDVETGQRLGGLEFRGATPVGFSPDSRHLYIVDGLLTALDGRTGKKQMDFGIGGRADKLFLSPDGKRFAVWNPSIIRPKEEQVVGVVLWDIASDKEIKRFSDHQEPLRAVSPDGKLILIDENYKRVRGQLVYPNTGAVDVVDAETGAIRSTIRHARDGSFGGSCLFTPDGKTLLNYDRNKDYVRFYDVPVAK